MSRADLISLLLSGIDILFWLLDFYKRLAQNSVLICS